MQHADIGAKCTGRLIRQSRLGPAARKLQVRFVCNVCDLVLSERALQAAAKTHKRNMNWKRRNATSE